MIRCGHDFEGAAGQILRGELGDVSGLQLGDSLPHEHRFGLALEIDIWLAAYVHGDEPDRPPVNRQGRSPG